MESKYAKWLVCGGRDYDHQARLFEALFELRKQLGQPTVVITGGCRGADALAGSWAVANGIHHAEVRALWGYYDAPKAGPIRNRAMLVLEPDVVIAFPGGSGTRDMIKAAKQAGVEVICQR